MEDDEEWFTFEWTEREDRCDRCGGAMDTGRIDLHLVGRRVTLHNMIWYVCRTPGCGQTKLSPAFEKLVGEIEASVERAVSASAQSSDRSPKSVKDQEPVPA
jgi:hypothetical protein